MNFRIRKEKIQALFEKLNASYKPSEEKPWVKIAEAVLFLPALGLFYLWEFFDKFNINYFDYFELKDSLEVLYNSLMPIILIGVILSIMLGVLVPDIIKRKDKNHTPQDGDADEVATGIRTGTTISNLFAILLAVVILFGFFILMKAYQFEIKEIIILLCTAAVACFFYLKGLRNLGFIIVLILAVLFAIVRANTDAKITVKERLTQNILLKSHSDEPVLLEGDKCRYRIYKNSNYYFIKDDCRNKIFIYSISNNEVVNFKSK